MLKSIFVAACLGALGSTSAADAATKLVANVVRGWVTNDG